MVVSPLGGPVSNRASRREKRLFDGTAAGEVILTTAHEIYMMNKLMFRYSSTTVLASKIFCHFILIQPVYIPPTVQGALHYIMARSSQMSRTAGPPGDGSMLVLSMAGA
jgi:hypothetical protein